MGKLLSWTEEKGSAEGPRGFPILFHLARHDSKLIAQVVIARSLGEKREEKKGLAAEVEEQNKYDKILI